MSREERETTRPQYHVIKIVLAGAGGVGKTCIASRLITDSYIETEMTKGLNVEAWEMVDESCDTLFKMVSIDLGGQSQFRFFQDGLVKGASIVLVVFDVTRYESLLELDEWKEMLADIPTSQRLLIGNKMDLGNQISQSEIDELEKEWDAKCIFVSTLTGENFEEVDEFLLRACRAITGMQGTEMRMR